MRIDDDGIRVPADCEDRLGLEISGRHVWAVVPARDGRRVEDGQRLISWPKYLKPYLNGRADMVVRSLETSDVLLEETVRLGSGEGVVELVDRQGRPLTVTKNGRVTSAMFGDVGDEARRQIAQGVVDTLGFMRDRGHEAFLAYGNLLGAVRNGRLIGHDNDADVAYLARGTHPADIVLESMRIEREFADAGWYTFRANGAAFKVYTTLSDGRRIGIDVFTAFYLDGLFQMVPYVAAPLDVETMLPVSTVELEGVEVPAPAQPEALLEATYGSNWRVPDPSFKYQPERSMRRRFAGLFGGDRLHVNYWDGFYSTKADAVPSEPSAFARWVAEHDGRPGSLVDVGSGTGRDALWLAEQGIRVLGCDYSPVAVRYAAHQAEERGCSATFRQLDLYDLREMLSVGARIGHEANTDGVYARFLVHALEDAGRRNLWRFSRSVLSGTRGRLFLEFRTEATEHEFGEHFRRFVGADTVCSELASYGFDVEHCEDRHGLAVYKDEDPRVARIVARFAR